MNCATVRAGPRSDLQTEGCLIRTTAGAGARGGCPSVTEEDSAPSPMGFVLDLTANLTESCMGNAPVEPRFLGHVLAGGFLRSLGAGHYALDVQVLKTDHPKALGQIIRQLVLGVLHRTLLGAQCFLGVL